MKEPFVTTILLFLPILVACLYYFSKKQYGQYLSRTVVYLLLVISSLVLLFCLVFVVLSIDNSKVTSFEPSSFIFITAIIMFLGGLIDIYIKTIHFIRISFIMVFLPTYSLIIIIWKILSHFL